MQITIQYMPDDGQCCTETVAFYNTLGCPLSKADRGPTKTLSSFIQDLQRSSLVNPPASPRAGSHHDWYKLNATEHILDEMRLECYPKMIYEVLLNLETTTN